MGAPRRGFRRRPSGGPAAARGAGFWSGGPRGAAMGAVLPWGVTRVLTGMYMGVFFLRGLEDGEVAANFLRASVDGSFMSR